MVRGTEKEGSCLLVGGMPSALTVGKHVLCVKAFTNKDIMV